MMVLSGHDGPTPAYATTNFVDRNGASVAPRKPPKHIRTLALAILLHRDHLLCARGYDEVKQQTFYRPLGGGVDFGERASEAVARELREEIDRAVEAVELLAVTENIFTFNGGAGHEVCFEYVTKFALGAAPDDLSEVVCDEHGRSFTASWLPLAEVLGGMHVVYPEGLRERLAGWVNRL
jgi:ADP-ribose pyrophosphatase YjhB (NUDIX family)